MVHGFASLAAVPSKLLLFLTGILLATFVLAYIGFSSIHSLELIEEKKYENAKVSLENTIIKNSKQETEIIVEEIKKTSDIFSLQNSLSGILSLFIFKDAVLIEPKINDFNNSKIYMVEQSDAQELKHFLDLQKDKNYIEAKEYALEKVNLFMKNPNIERLNWNNYFLEKMLNTLIQEKSLNAEDRKQVSDTLIKVEKLLQNLNTYYLYKDFLQVLGSYTCYSNEEYSFIEHNGETFLAISDAINKKAVIAKIDSAYYSNRVIKIINETTKEWNFIQYSIAGNFPFGNWNILFKENIEEIKKESGKRKNILYAMTIFALIILITGVIVVYNGLSGERKLRLMKDNFLSTISHELKTPLTSIKMYSELINSGRIQKPEKIISHTEVILKETNRLEHLIETILNYTRMENGKHTFRLENINMSNCVNKVCDSLDFIANSKNLIIKREIEVDCNIVGDYPSIYSLVQNLIDNAIKYTKEGFIFVKLNSSQGISFSVADTGVGIPLSEQKHIFERFYRVGDEATRETKGSGLGLAIVKRTVDAHKASITVKSYVGKGSTFTVTFYKNNAI